MSPLPDSHRLSSTSGACCVPNQDHTAVVPRREIFGVIFTSPLDNVHDALGRFAEPRDGLCVDVLVEDVERAYDCN